ncbi:hypothetical protein [Hymenobacter sp. 102]|uniref:hypothetical protein n=1 Tax=Hymenobacter sp. 102 TaxID=3403152 RepID=UPI003CEEC934
MKHFVACLLMLLLLVMGKYNRYRQPPLSLAREGAGPAAARPAGRTPQARTAAVAPRVAALVAR